MINWSDNLPTSGTSWKCVGAFGLSEHREKSFGAPEARIPKGQVFPPGNPNPQGTIFLSKPLQGTDLSGSPTHYPDEPAIAKVGVCRYGSGSLIGSPGAKRDGAVFLVWLVKKERGSRRKMLREPRICTNLLVNQYF